MSSNSGDLKILTDTKNQDNLNPSLISEHDLLEKNKSILNVHILQTIRELEWAKINYICNATNQIKIINERLANLISQVNIKLQKCRSLFKISNSFNSSDPSYIQFLLMQSENENADCLSKFLHTQDVSNNSLAKSNISFASYKKIETQEMNEFKYNTGCLIGFEKDLTKFQAINNKLDFNQKIYDYLMQMINEMEKKWLRIESFKEEIVQRYKSNAKYQILINFSKNFNLSYQSYIKKYNQLSESYKKTIEDINQNYPKQYCSDIIYLGDLNWITSLDTNKGDKQYHSLKKGFSLAIPLPNNELFCCGSYRYDWDRRCGNHEVRPPDRHAYILDCTTFKRKKKFSYWYRMEDYRGLYLNGFIYLFNYKEAISFNIDTGKRKKISPLPTDLRRNCSCIPFKKNIIVCGEQNSNIYKYDTAIDSYSTLDLTLNDSCKKLLCFCSRRAYVIEFNGFIYESEFENEFCWSAICEGNIPYKFTEIYWINSNNCIWFGILDTHHEGDYKSVSYFSFDIKKRSLSEFEPYEIFGKNKTSSGSRKEYYKSISLNNS